MLITDIVRRVRDVAGDTAVLQFTNTTLTDWINDAIRECVTDNSLLQARASSNTVVGQSDYSLPTDIFKVHSVTLNGFKLEMLTLEEWEERNASEPQETTPDESSDPFQCYVYAGVLTLWPKPDSVKSLVINYTKMPAEIVYTASPEDWTPGTPAIPESFHSRIVTYCLAQVALQDEDFAKYQNLMSEFKTGIVNLKHQAETQDDLYPFISTSLDDHQGYYRW